MPQLGLCVFRLGLILQTEVVLFAFAVVVEAVLGKVELFSRMYKPP